MSKFLPFNLFIRQALLYPLVAPFLPAVNKVLKGFKYAAGKLTGTLDITPPWGVPKTGQTVKYRTGDDGDFEKGYPLVPPRFVDNEDGTITDRATGLMWYAADDLGYIKWDAAIDACLALNFAGHQDWRLPNVDELFTLLDFSKAAGAKIDLTFFACGTVSYWSSTTWASLTTKAKMVNFFYADVRDLLKTEWEKYRPVRLGIPAD